LQNRKRPTETPKSFKVSLLDSSIGTSNPTAIGIGKGPLMAVQLGGRVLPCLLTADMRRTLDFYIDVLGFTQTGYYPIESEPIRTEVRRDEVALIFFTEATHNLGEEPAFSGALYFFPDDINQMAEELQPKVPFEWGPEDSDLGVREFAIRDPNGYVLVFAQRAHSQR
jgi:catechol 2,3-dioxygenase-like lactoylglutathione lyase family enzyme